MAYARRFGEIPGHPEGTKYSQREEVRLAGLHAHRQTGIPGTRHEGADAIVLSGGYRDDEDYGDVIIYTGHGGQDGNNKQVADQSLNDSGNSALVKSQLDNLPVRVIRGFEEPSKYAPETGYQYGGLYRIVRHWFTNGKDGFRICQFRMVKIDSQHDFVGVEDLLDAQLTDSPTKEPTQPGQPAKRNPVTTNRIQRRVEVVVNVKKWHDNVCQICGKTVDLPNGPSSQTAHIRPLGVPHNGPDSEANGLCLCPNDHVRFDNGALYLTDDLEIIDALNGKNLGKLRTHPRHVIDIEHVRHHRSCWIKDTQEP